MKLKKQTAIRRATMALVVIGVAIPAALAAQSMSTHVTFEAESGTTTGNTSTKSDVSASNGSYLQFGPDGVPDPTAGWEEAVASKDIGVVRDWYELRTGFESYYDPGLGRYLAESDLEPMNGLDIYEDNVVIEGKDINGRIRIFGDNVTIRGSRISINSYTYGVQATEVNLGAPTPQPAGENWKIEHVTFRYTGTDNGNRPVYASSSGKASYLKVLDGFSSAFRSESSYDQVWEYNYADRIVSSEGSHNTAFTLRSNTGNVANKNITIRRNLLLDGTSSALSFYAGSSGLHQSILFEENIFDMIHAQARGWTVHYCVIAGSGGDKFSNVRWVGNIFGQTQTPICGTSNYATEMAGSEWSGNKFIDGTSVQ